MAAHNAKDVFSIFKSGNKSPAVSNKKRKDEKRQEAEETEEPKKKKQKVTENEIKPILEDKHVNGTDDNKQSIKADENKKEAERRLIAGSDGCTIDSSGVVRNKYGRETKLVQDIGGYVQCKIPLQNGKRRNRFVHRLVALAFLSNPDSRRTVNHIDGIKTNNSLSNLEWATDKENTTHAFQTGLKTNKRKSRPKMSDDDLKVEIWKSTTLHKKGQEFPLEVSNMGRYRTKRAILAVHHRRFIINRQGVAASFDASRVTCAVFNGPAPSDTHRVEHKDKNKDNRRPDNLQWITTKESVRKIKTVRRVVQKTKRGEVIKIFGSCAEASEQTGVRVRNIFAALAGQSPSAGGYRWERMIE